MEKGKQSEIAAYHLINQNATPPRQINENKIPENSFWANTNEDTLMSSELKQKLIESYCNNADKAANRNVKSDQIDNAPKPIKKTISFRALDGKIAQNIMILLGSMKRTADEVKQYIISMDETNLTEESVQQLIKCVPPSDQIKKLEQSRSDYDRLHPAEQAMLSVSSRIDHCHIEVCGLTILSQSKTAHIDQPTGRSFAALVVQDEL